MTHMKFHAKILLAAVVGGLLTVAVTGCSNDKPSDAKTAAKPNHNPNPFDHSGEAKVTDSQKRQFQHDFTAQCIEREAHNAGTPEDKERFSKPCTCIGQFLAKDLTAQEAEKFLAEHEDPQSLRIKYENAAYHCLQEKVPPKEPDFSRPQ